MLVDDPIVDAASAAVVSSFAAMVDVLEIVAQVEMARGKTAVAQDFVMVALYCASIAQDLTSDLNLA